MPWILREKQQLRRWNSFRFKILFRLEQVSVEISDSGRPSFLEGQQDDKRVVQVFCWSGPWWSSIGVQVPGKWDKEHLRISSHLTLWFHFTMLLSWVSNVRSFGLSPFRMSTALKDSAGAPGRLPSFGGPSQRLASLVTDALGNDLSKVPAQPQMVIILRLRCEVFVQNVRSTPKHIFWMFLANVRFSPGRTTAFPWRAARLFAAARAHQATSGSYSGATQLAERLCGSIGFVLIEKQRPFVSFCLQYSFAFYIISCY